VTTFKITLDHESRKLLRTARRKLDPEVIAQDIVAHFERDGQRVRAAVVKGFLSGPTGPTSRARRTGELARSVVGRGTMVDGLPAIQVGSFRLPYARVQLGDETTTIKPTKSKALAIPVGVALTAAGRPRYPAGPRSFPTKLTFVPFRRSTGNIIGALYEASKLKAAAKKARRSKSPMSLRDVRAVFLLAKQVRIQGSGALRRGFNDQLPGIVGRLSSAIERILKTRLRTS